MGAETRRWFQDGCFAAWSNDNHRGTLIIQSFRFDTEEHAADVWGRLRDLEGWDDQYEIEGLPSIHVGVAEIAAGTGFHEASRHVGRHLVTFALTGRSATARPDPTLEQILRRHVQEFPN